MISDEQSTVIELFSLIDNVLFYLAAFRILSLSLAFRSLMMMCLVMDFIEFFLFGLYPASSNCSFMSLTKFRQFPIIIPLSTF